MPENASSIFLYLVSNSGDCPVKISFVELYLKDPFIFAFTIPLSFDAEKSVV